LTKPGYGFIAVGVILYLVASQTQVGWLYLIDAVIWSLLALSAILPRYSLKSLQLEQQILLSATSGEQLSLAGPVEDETIEIRLKVSNSGRLTRHFIGLQVDCSFELPEQQRRDFLLTTLAPGEKTLFSYTGTCYRRGHYPSSSATLQYGGPLGLVVSRRTFKLPLNLTVYPHYYPVERLQTTGEDRFELGQGIKTTAAIEFYGSREYQYGDSLKHIHWRNTAKTGHIMLKEFEQSGLGLVSVVFGTDSDFGAGRDTTLEYSIKITASLAKLCADSGRGIDIIAGKTPLHNANWQTAMDYLANLKADEKDAKLELTEFSGRGGSVVAVLPVIETGLSTIVAELSKRVGRLVVILLEGFTSDKEPPKTLSGPVDNNIDIIYCSPGNLKSVIEKLSRVDPFTDNPLLRVS